MRGRVVAAVLVLVGMAAPAVLGPGGGTALADAAGAAEPQFFDTWGSAGSADGQLQNPRGVSVNQATGDVYVADTGNDRVVRYDRDGRLVAVIDTADGVPLDNPWDVAVNEVANTLWVADTGNDRVVHYSVDDLFLRSIGTTGAGQYGFRSPRGVHVGGDGTLYVADTGNNKVKVYNGTTGLYLAPQVARGAGAGQLNGPRDVAGDSDHSTRLFIADTGNDRISVWDVIGHTYVGTFGSTGTGNRRFEAPAGLWEGGDTAATESIFVADTGNDRISVWRYDAGTDTATWESRFGTAGARHEELEAPRSVAVDADLRRFVADTTNDRVQILVPSGPPGIFGRVTNTFGAGVNAVTVLAQDASTFDLVVAGETDRDGNYQLPLPPGDYLLTFFDPDGGHAPEYHPDVTSFDQATAVPVQANTVTRVDASLSVNGIVPNPNTGTITGTVTEQAGPAARTWVLAVDANTGSLVKATQVDPAGDYEIASLATGNYVVVFLDPRGVNTTEFFSDHPDPAQADQVPVVSGGAAAIVNAALQP